LAQSRRAKKAKKGLKKRRIMVSIRAKDANPRTDDSREMTVET
jgi:hypothetical protein